MSDVGAASILPLAFLSTYSLRLISIPKVFHHHQGKTSLRSMTPNASSSLQWYQVRHV